MHDSSRTTQELIEENALLKQRIKELEHSESECKRVEKVLKESNDKFIGLVSSIPGYIAYVNANTLQYEFVNDAFEKSFGVPREKIIGCHIKDIIGETNYQFALKYIEKVRLGKSISYENTFDLVSDKRWIQVNYAPIIDAHGHVTSIAVLSYDITEHKLTEEALRESEEKFRTIFENSSSAMAIIERDTTISMVNREYCKLGLFDEMDIIGKSWTAQIPPGDLERLKEYNRRRLIDPNSAPDHYEFTFYRKDGEIRHSLMSVAIIPTSQKIICSFVDITERKQAEESLEEERKRLQQALDEVRTLRGIVPICARCKNIRDDKGFWNQVEKYVSEHTEAEFSHGICPDCAKKLYPKFFK